MTTLARMGILKNLAAKPIGVAAEERIKAGGRVFAYRLHVPPTQLGEVPALADAIEAAETFGWRLASMEADDSVGGQRSWMLLFRSGT